MAGLTNSTRMLAFDLCPPAPYKTQRVQVPNNYVFRVIVITAQVMGKYMITRYSDP